MAIKVIKPATSLFRMECPRCECVFEYTSNDILQLSYDCVTCPCCAKRIDHSWRKENTDNG